MIGLHLVNESYRKYKIIQTVEHNVPILEV